MIQGKEVKSNGWCHIGPGGGGAQFIPAIHPDNPDVAFIACDMSGLYHTVDGGYTWRMIRLSGTAGCIAIDPHNPDTVYVGTYALFRSMDGGESWQRVLPKGKEDPIVFGDEAALKFPAEGVWPGGWVTAIEIDPDVEKNIYMGCSVPFFFRENSAPKLLHSADGGDTWEDEGAPPEGTSIFRILADQESVGKLFVATERGIFYRNNERWEPCRKGLPQGGIVDFTGGMSRASGKTLLYATVSWKEGEEAHTGVFFSEDKGESWQRVESARTSPENFPQVEGARSRFRRIAACRSCPEVVYLGTTYDVGEDKENLYGAFKSCDGGKSWEMTLRGDPRLKSRNVETGWMADDPGWYWHGMPQSITVADKNPDVCYVTDDGTSLRTVDGGKTWQQIYCRMNPDGTASSCGMEVTTCYGVHFDPFDKENVFITYTDIGLFNSRDGGRSWSRALSGVPRGWRNTAYWLEFDPEVEGRLWAVFSSGHDLPRNKMFRGDVLRFRGGVSLSEDGGRTWKALSGLPENACTWILLDPTSSIDAKTLYVTVFGRGVYKSTDGGKTWQGKSNGLGENRNVWKIYRAKEGMLYLIVSRSGADDKAKGGGLYFSQDKGESWRPLETAQVFPNLHDLAIHPEDPAVLYVASWPITIEGKRYPGGVLRSKDRGKSWQSILNDAEYVWGLTIDPEHPEIIYAATFYDGVLRSEDGGKSWIKLGGFPFRNAHRVILDPYDPESLYVTTFGGGILRGQGKG